MNLRNRLCGDSELYDPSIRQDKRSRVSTDCSFLPRAMDGDGQLASSKMPPENRAILKELRVRHCLSEP